MSITLEHQPSIMIIVLDGNAALGMPMLGILVLSQNGNEAVPALSELAFVDPGHPYEIAFDGIHRMVIAAVPREFVEARSRDLRRVEPRRVLARHVLGPASSPSSVGVALGVGHAGLVPSAQPPDAVLDLLAARLGQVTGTPAAAADRLEDDRSKLLTRIHRFIESNLRDPELSPQSVAAAHYFSLRYLQKLFQSEGTTVNAWIRSRRLEKCRAELLDPRHQNRSIAAVGARWNLSPASYFSRVFREAYGISPREMRASAGWRDDGRSLRR
jgi:AraC-like DNA-binding protein